MMKLDIRFLWGHPPFSKVPGLFSMIFSASMAADANMGGSDAEKQ